PGKRGGFRVRIPGDPVHEAPVGRCTKSRKFRVPFPGSSPLFSVCRIPVRHGDWVDAGPGRAGESSNGMAGSDRGGFVRGLERRGERPGALWGRTGRETCTESQYARGSRSFFRVPNPGTLAEPASGFASGRWRASAGGVVHTCWAEL